VARTATHPPVGPRTTRTLAVSDAFAEMVTDLAKSHGLTVEQFCDRHAAPKLAPDYEALLSTKLTATKRLTAPNNAKSGA
jgi:hypothetical protein